MRWELVSLMDVSPSPKPGYMHTMTWLDFTKRTSRVADHSRFFFSKKHFSWRKEEKKNQDKPVLFFLCLLLIFFFLCKQWNVGRGDTGLTVNYSWRRICLYNVGAFVSFFFYFLLSTKRKFECKCVSPAGEKISWKVFSHFRGRTTRRTTKNGIERKRKEAAYICIVRKGMENLFRFLSGCLKLIKKKKNFHLFSLVTFTRCFIARYLRGMIVQQTSIAACPFGIAIRRTDTYREEDF